jgi:small subunit ribosomal protein S6
MATETPTYDLMLILDPQAQDDVRARIAAETVAAIEGQGELVRHDDWGERPLSYPIDRRATGEYHLLQFRPSNVELLGSLDHSLRIADGVLRFRVIKLREGAPEGPVPVPPAPARRSEPRRDVPPAPQPQEQEPAPAAAEPQPEPEAEAQQPAPEAPAPVEDAASDAPGEPA